VTGAQRRAAEDWISGLKEWAPSITVVLGIGYAIYGIISGLITFYSGGLVTKNQIDQEAIKAQLNVYQTAQTTQLNDIQKSQTAQFNETKLAQERIMARLDAMPRPSDYTEQQQHLRQIDLTFGTVGDRFVADELAAKGLDGRVTALERAQTQFRNPQH
jgi:hypothetical protein